MARRSVSEGYPASPDKKIRDKVPIPLSIRRTFSKRFSGSSSPSTPPSASTVNSAGTCSTTTSSSTNATATTTVTANLVRAGIIGDPSNHKRHSITKATLFASPDDKGILADDEASPNAVRSPRKSSTSFRRASGPLPETHPAFGIVPITNSQGTPLCKHDSKVTLTNGKSPATADAYPESIFSSRLATTAPSGRSVSMPLEINHSLPPYVLDRLHPYIPFPATWTAEHDEYIVSLDFHDYHLAAIVARVKQRYPEMRGETITPGMLDKRLRILDMRVEWPGWKMAMRGKSSSEEDDIILEEASSNRSDTSMPKANAKKVVSPKENKHTRRVSTGGRSGKIVINKRGTMVGPVYPSYPSPSSISSSSPHASNGQPVKDTSIERKPPLSASSPIGAGSPIIGGTPLGTSCPLDGVSTLPSGCSKAATGPTSSQLAAKKLAEAKKTKTHCMPAEFEEPFGVPSVMRTSSGKPVLR